MIHADSLGPTDENPPPPGAPAPGLPLGHDVPSWDDALAAIVARLTARGGWWATHAEWAARKWSSSVDWDHRWVVREAATYSGVSVEEASAAYRLGRLAADHPDHRARPFEEVESELAGAWGGDSYERVQRFVRLGFERRQSARRSSETRRRKTAEEVRRRRPDRGPRQRG